MGSCVEEAKGTFDGRICRPRLVCAADLCAAVFPKGSLAESLSSCVEGMDGPPREPFCCLVESSSLEAAVKFVKVAVLRIGLFKVELAMSFSRHVLLDRLHCPPLGMVIRLSR